MTLKRVVDTLVSVGAALLMIVVWFVFTVGTFAVYVVAFLAAIWLLVKLFGVFF